MNTRKERSWYFALSQLVVAPIGCSGTQRGFFSFCRAVFIFFLIHIFHKNERSISLSPRQFFISYITLLVFQRYVVVRISQYGASSNNCCHLTCDLNCARSLQKKNSNKIKSERRRRWYLRPIYLINTLLMLDIGHSFKRYGLSVSKYRLSEEI